VPTNVRLDGVDIIKSQTNKSLVVDDVVTILENVDLADGNTLPVAKLDGTQQAGQVLTLNVDGKWRNQDITAAGAAVNNDLGISRTGASSDPSIEYDFGNDPNTTFLLNGSNATISGLADGDTVMWDSNDNVWKNKPAVGAAGFGFVVSVNADGDNVYTFGTKGFTDSSLNADGDNVLTFGTN